MHRVRVVIAERNRDHAELLAMLFESFGCVAHFACDASSALALIEAHCPDAIVVDDDLTGNNALIRAARELNPEGVYVVCTTAWELDLHAAGRSCDARLLKPYDFEKMWGAVGAFIARREAQKRHSTGR